MLQRLNSIDNRIDSKATKVLGKNKIAPLYLIFF